MTRNERERSQPPAVGILVVTHGPLADAICETVRLLDPASASTLGALAVGADEAPEKASQRLSEAIRAADNGRGVVLLTDMFGGTPSNLALAFRQKDRVEIVSGVNLPMALKALALACDGSTPGEMARTLVIKARRAIVAASELMEPERRSP